MSITFEERIPHITIFSSFRFRLQVTKQEATVLEAAVVLNDTLNYNQRMVYHFQIEATDGTHKTQTTFEARVKDVQDKPPVFQGSLSTVIDEDSPINTLVLTVHARDGDTGEPRKIVYDLLTSRIGNWGFVLYQYQ